MATPELILGVDPGLSGAIAAVTYDPIRSLFAYADMPTTTRGSKNQIAIYDLAFWISTLSDRVRFAVVEDVSAMKYTTKDGQVRGQGAAASFSFGKTAGVIEGILAAHGKPIYFVKPATWKLALGLSHNKNDSRALATKLFPESEGAWPLKKHDGRAEAALLAHFGASRFQ